LCSYYLPRREEREIFQYHKPNYSFESASPLNVQQLLRTKAETKGTLPTTKQVQVKQSFERVRTFQRDNLKAKSINAKIMEFIALNNHQPFSVVDDVGFRRLVEQLEP
jgi:hypothetical protein